jgi:hypothetical protein
MKKLIQAVAVVAVALTCQAASAKWVKFRFTGQVTASGVMPDGTTPPVGSPVTGSFAYDAATPYADQTSGETTDFTYFALQKPAYLKFQFGEHEAVSHHTYVWMVNNRQGAAGDRIDLDSLEQNTRIDGVRSASAFMGLTLSANQEQADWLTSPTLPSKIAATNLDASSSHGLLYGDDETLLVMFSIDKITSKACPLDQTGHVDCR